MNEVKINMEPVEPLEVRALRPRAELEQMIAAQIALGTTTSLEEAEERGDEEALEYCAQMLLDDVRIRISEREDLPLPIIRHLSKDRNKEVRGTIMGRYFDVMSEETQDIFYRDAVLAHKQIQQVTEWKRDQHEAWPIIRALHVIMHRHVERGEDDFIVEMLERLEHQQGQKVSWLDQEDRLLRFLPKTVERIYDSNLPKMRLIKLMRAEPMDRLAAVEQVLKMKVGEMRDTFSTFRQDEKYDDVHIKTTLFNFIATDPSPMIRRVVLSTITHLPTLTRMADEEHEPNIMIRRRAAAKAARVKNRADYAKKYHEELDRKLRNKGTA